MKVPAEQPEERALVEWTLIEPKQRPVDRSDRRAVEALNYSRRYFYFHFVGKIA
jgi:hypothetical protein